MWTMRVRGTGAGVVIEVLASSLQVFSVLSSATKARPAVARGCVVGKSG